MKWMKSGPELKMPDLKVPEFLVDLYWDLRDRHLLPLVGLVIVAIVAVPFLLGGGGSKEESTPAIAGASDAPSPEPAARAKLTVVEAKPGLRDYRKRLREQSPADPFTQRYTSPVLKGAKLGGGGSEGGDASTSTSVTSTSKTTTKTTKDEDRSSTTTTTTTTTDDGNGVPAGGVVHYTFGIDVKITRIETLADGSKEKTPIERERVVSPGPLPGAKQQVVTYMGLSPKTKVPLLLVSDQVSAVYGEAKCLSGEGSCQLLEVLPGLPVTFVYGAADVRYKVLITAVKPVILDVTDGQ